MKKNKQSKKIKLMISRRRIASDEHYKSWKKSRKTHMQGVSNVDRPAELKKHDSLREKRKLKTIQAPSKLSFNQHTDNVVKFISSIEAQYTQGNGVFIDLNRVTEIDYGAIVTLLSILIQFRKKRIKINGNFPADRRCEKILMESGFLYNLYKKECDEDRHLISNGADSSIVTHGWSKVDTALSANIIKESAKTVWGSERRCQGIQRCIGELMLNTNNHAKPGEKGAMNWWLYINHDNEKKIVSFAFVDFGIGIFESLKNKPKESKFFGWLEKIKGKLLNYDNPKILKYILSGEFHQTVTGNYYRGKGLPGINEAFNRNQMSNLLIVSNDTFGDVQNQKYAQIDSNFSGTYVYWELNSENEYCE